MDIDEDLLNSTPRPRPSRGRLARPSPKTGLVPYVEVPILVSSKAGKKRVRADSEVEVPETRKERKEKTKDKKEKDMGLPNITLEDGTVVIRGDDLSIPTVNLRQVTVTEMDVVDLDVVPFLVNKVGFSRLPCYP